MLLSAMNTVIADILSKRRDLTQEHIISLIEQKKKEGRGLLSDEGAARLVAEELLVQSRGMELGRMQVKNLVSGLNDVSISGRVLLAWPHQQFQRRDGTPGRVMRLTLIDKSGRIRCALWDRHVDIASRAGALQGRIIRIGHAYTRQGLSGEPEVQAGERSSIEIDPIDIPTSDFPDLKDLFSQISSLIETSMNVNTVGIIDSEPRYHTFTKEGRSGHVLHATLSDESGTISLVAWNEKAEELRGLKRSNVLQIMNGRTKLDANSRLELHVESRSQVSILSSSPEFLRPPKSPETPVLRKFKIAELTGQLGIVDLTALVLMKSEPREVKRTSTNETVKVSTVIVADETGVTSVSLWDDNASLVSGIREGETVELQGISVREAMGELKLNLARSGTLQKIQASMQITPPITKLNAIENSKSLLIVEGTASDEPLIRQVVTAKGESVNVASFTIRDDTTSAKVSMWRDQVEIAKRIHPGTPLRITGLRTRLNMGQLELSTIPLSKIELIEPPSRTNQKDQGKFDLTKQNDSVAKV